ncbi:MAG TPA: universal stress protein [Burkholderiales bacterium]|jgi:nucleotide-binding universal stress UspA family protein
MKILLAVDGTAHSLDAVKCVIDHADWYREKPQVELVTVHRPVPKLPRMGVAVGKAQIERYYQEEGEQALAEAKKLLERAGLRYEPRVLVGDPAEVIVKHAKQSRADVICVGTPAKWIGSTANKVMNLSEVPVLLVK